MIDMLFVTLESWRLQGINAEDYWERDWTIRPGSNVESTNMKGGVVIVVTLRALSARKNRDGSVIAHGYNFSLIEHDYMDPVRNTVTDVKNILERMIKRMERKALHGERGRGAGMR